LWASKKIERLEENLAAVNVELTTADLRDIDEAASKIRVRGATARSGA
jgi:aryl-alcohol dehydrogenase-like predicted oxidoreductase